MRANWRIGSLFGIPFYINSSWFLILAFVTAINATDERIQWLAGGIPYRAWSIGFGIALLLFISVLLHELGHSLAARSRGIEVNSITLFLFGGMASIERESRTANEALLVAIAGPAVSFFLFGGLSLSEHWLDLSAASRYIVGDIARINLFLGLFNLIPGLPLDGGQIVKAIVWKVTGDRFKGVRLASVSGQAIGTLGIIFALALVLLTGEVGGAWLGLVGWFILRNATAYERRTELQQSLLSLTAAEAMTRDFRVVNARQSVEAFAADYILVPNAASIAYFAASEGRYRGEIRPTDLQTIERGDWKTKLLLDIARPLGEIATAREKTLLVDVVRELERSRERRLTVLTPAGAVAGVIDRGDIVKAIAEKYQLPLRDGEIERVKADGIYPSYFPLDEIASALEKSEPPKIGEPSPIS